MFFLLLITVFVLFAAPQWQWFSNVWVPAIVKTNVHFQFLQPLTVNQCALVLVAILQSRSLKEKRTRSGETSIAKNKLNNYTEREIF